MSADRPFWDIARLVAAYRSGEACPVEVTQQALARIGRLDGAVNAMTRVTAPLALAAAEVAKARWQAGHPAGPLDGVPITVKDTLAVAGVPCRRGSLITPDTPATEDAPAVARTREAGAVIVGITTTPEFGSGPITNSPLTGTTRSPWDRAMNAGGSSGGAAVSVAAGFAYAALGTDAGGSIRIPAGFCGVVGFKPTGGRVPIHPANPAGALVTPAAITRTVDDARRLLSIIAQPDPRDPDALPEPAPDWLDPPVGGLSGLRVALSADLGYAVRVDPQIVATLGEAGDALRALGLTVCEAHPDHGDPVAIYNTLFKAGFGYALRHQDEAGLALMGDHLRRTAEEGARIDLHTYLAAQDARRALCSAYARLFERFDLLLTPMLATTGVPEGAWVPPEFADCPDQRAWTPFGYPVNLIQSPAITLASTLSREGRPIGLQLIGPRHSEARLLAVAEAFEAKRQPLGPPPGFGEEAIAGR